METKKDAIGLSPMLQEAIRQEQERRAADPVWKEIYRLRDSDSALLDLALKESGALRDWIQGAIDTRRRLFDDIEYRVAWLERTAKLNEELRMNLSNRILHLEELAEKREETINRLWRRIGALELAVFPAMEEEDDFFEEAQK